jgi:hypothetical protein
MSKKIYLLLLLVSGFANAQVVSIPDANFKTFLTAGFVIDTDSDGTTDASVDTNADGQIQLSEALAVTSLIFDGGQVLDVTGLEAFTNLQSLTMHFYPLTNLDVTALNQLVTLDCNGMSLTTLTIGNKPNLTLLNCSANQLPELDHSGCPNLTSLVCADNKLTVLDVTGLSGLELLNCDDNLITDLQVSGLANLETLSCFYNQLTAINLNGLPNLKTFNCHYNLLPTLNLTNLTQLEVLDCSENLLTALDLTGLDQLKQLYCYLNGITSLSVSHLSNLKEFDCSANALTVLDVTALTQLLRLNCGQNQLTTMNVLPLVNLERYACYNNPLNSINIAPLVNLEVLDCHTTNLTTLDISNQVKLWRLGCDNNSLTDLELSHSPYLSEVNCNQNLFTTLDFSHLTEYAVNSLHHTTFYFDNNPNLQYVNCKTPLFTADFFAANCPNLTYLCADESTFSNVLVMLGLYGLTDVEVNTYCSFDPTGPHNRIQGTFSYDTDANGCSASDLKIPYMKVGITNGTTSGMGFSKTDGSYAFRTESGNFTLTPQFENPFFTVSPATATVNFPDLDDEQTRDFCVSANGFHPDLEIVLAPIGGARPGFDANYQIVYRNKGNQIQSGQINLTYDEAHTDFVSADPATSNQAPGLLTWNFSALMPFEVRMISFILNVNSPVENPAVNAGDILPFTVQVTNGEGEETPLDNSFSLNQDVVNSFDPNDKTCLEGGNVLPGHIGKYLHYNINFENTGSADAVNIVVKDLIDTSKFDINSLQVMHASHPVDVRVAGNKVEFIFENINLPPAIMNPIGGHGNVLFKIKTLPTLSEDDSVTNTANIYFDYNHPIDTNQARTTFNNLSKTDFVKDNSVSVSPNPAKGRVAIKALNTIKLVQLYDMQGRILETSIENNKQTTLDMAQWQHGIYFVKVTTEKGSASQKIIKE